MNPIPEKYLLFAKRYLALLAKRVFDAAAEQKIERIFGILLKYGKIDATIGNLFKEAQYHGSAPEKSEEPVEEIVEKAAQSNNNAKPDFRIPIAINRKTFDDIKEVKELHFPPPNNEYSNKKVYSAFKGKHVELIITEKTNLSYHTSKTSYYRVWKEDDDVKAPEYNAYGDISFEISAKVQIIAKPQQVLQYSKLNEFANDILSDIVTDDELRNVREYVGSGSDIRENPEYFKTFSLAMPKTDEVKAYTLEIFNSRVSKEIFNKKGKDPNIEYEFNLPEDKDYFENFNLSIDYGNKLVIALRALDESLDTNQWDDEIESDMPGNIFSPIDEEKLKRFTYEKNGLHIAITRGMKNIRNSYPKELLYIEYIPVGDLKRMDGDFYRTLGAKFTDYGFKAYSNAKSIFKVMIWGLYSAKLFKELKSLLNSTALSAKGSLTFSAGHQAKERVHNIEKLKENNWKGYEVTDHYFYCGNSKYWVIDFVVPYSLKKFTYHKKAYPSKALIDYLIKNYKYDTHYYNGHGIQNPDEVAKFMEENSVFDYDTFSLRLKSEQRAVAPSGSEASAPKPAPEGGRCKNEVEILSISTKNKGTIKTIRMYLNYKPETEEWSYLKKQGFNPYQDDKKDWYYGAYYSDSKYEFAQNYCNKAEGLGDITVYEKESPEKFTTIQEEVEEFRKQIAAAGYDADKAIRTLDYCRAGFLALRKLEHIIKAANTFIDAYKSEMRKTGKAEMAYDVKKINFPFLKRIYLNILSVLTSRNRIEFEEEPFLSYQLMLENSRQKEFHFPKIYDASFGWSMSSRDGIMGKYVKAYLAILIKEQQDPSSPNYITKQLDKLKEKYKKFAKEYKIENIHGLGGVGGTLLERVESTGNYERFSALMQRIHMLRVRLEALNYEWDDDDKLEFKLQFSDHLEKLDSSELLKQYTNSKPMVRKGDIQAEAHKLWDKKQKARNAKKSKYRAEKIDIFTNEEFVLNACMALINQYETEFDEKKLDAKYMSDYLAKAAEISGIKNISDNNLYPHESLDEFDITGFRATQLFMYIYLPELFKKLKPHFEKHGFPAATDWGLMNKNAKLGAYKLLSIYEEGLGNFREYNLTSNDLIKIVDKGIEKYGDKFYKYTQQIKAPKVKLVTPFDKILNVSEPNTFYKSYFSKLCYKPRRTEEVEKMILLYYPLISDTYYGTKSDYLWATNSFAAIGMKVNPSFKKEILDAYHSKEIIKVIGKKQEKLDKTADQLYISQDMQHYVAEPTNKMYMVLGSSINPIHIHEDERLNDKLLKLNLKESIQLVAELENCFMSDFGDFGLVDITNDSGATVKVNSEYLIPALKAINAYAYSKLKYDYKNPKDIGARVDFAIARGKNVLVVSSGDCYALVMGIKDSANDLVGYHLTASKNELVYRAEKYVSDKGSK